MPLAPSQRRSPARSPGLSASPAGSGGAWTGQDAPATLPVPRDRRDAGAALPVPEDRRDAGATLPVPGDRCDHSTRGRAARAIVAAIALLAPACDDDGPYAPPPESNSACGPARATVVRAIDGDTIDLDTGDRVRYLMIDTPESTQGKIDCYGAEAHEYNAKLVEGQEVELVYDEQCRDTYGRLLAYVRTDAGEINRILVRQGYACLYSIPPNGYERLEEFQALEREASVLHLGLWGACSVVTCQH